MKNKKVSSLSVMTYFFKIAFKTRPSYPFLIFFIILINATQPFLSIIFPTLIIEELTKIATSTISEVTHYTTVAIGPKKELQKINIKK